MELGGFRWLCLRVQRGVAFDEVFFGESRKKCMESEIYLDNSHEITQIVYSHPFVS